MSAEPVPHTVLTLRLSMVGRSVKSYTFGKPAITIGRDPEADIFIDNPGVSREHLRVERTPEGSYEVVELGSANGSFLNDQPLSGRAPINDGDRVSLGKFTLTAQYGADRRDEPAARAPGDTDQHTMVLTRDEVAKVIELQRRAEVSPPEPPAGVAGGPAPGRASLPVGTAIGYMVAAYVVGAATGAAIVWFLLR